MLYAQGIIRPRSNELPAYGDLVAYFLPMWWFFRESILAGSLPVWESSQSFGYFFLGNPQCGLFHVPNYLLLLPQNFAYPAYIIGPYLLGGLGLFRSARYRNTPLPWALMQAWVAVGNPASLALHTMPTVSWTLAWLPWVYHLSHSKKWTLAGFVLGQSFLAGAWDVWGMSMVGIAALLWPLGLHRKPWFWFGALSLVPTQIAWSWLLLAETSRGSGLTPQEAMFWSAGMQHFLGFFSPRVELSAFGAGAWVGFWGKRQSWLMATYIGIWALMMLPLLLQRFYRKKPFLLVVNSVLLLCGFLPSIPWVRDFVVAQGLRLPVRYPDKLLILPILLFAVAGFEQMRFISRWVFRKAWRVVALGAWLLLLVGMAWPLLLSRSLSMTLDKGATEVFRRFYFEEVWGDIQSVGVLYLILLVAWIAFRKFKPSTWIFLWGALACGEVCFNGTRWGNFAMIPRSNQEQASVTTYGYTLPRVPDSLFEPKEDAAILRSTLTPIWKSIAWFPFLAMDSGIAMTNLNNVLPIGRTAQYQSMFDGDPARDSALFWRAGISTLLAYGPGASTSLARFCPELLVTDDSSVLMCRRLAAPLVRVVSRGFFVGDRQKAARLLDSIPVPADAVLLEQRGLTGVTAGGPGGQSGSQVKIRSWWNGRFEAVVDGVKPGWVVFLVPPMGILEATVDGQSRPILKADLAFSAIFLQPGRHTVLIQPRRWVLHLLTGHLALLLISWGVIWYLDRRSGR